MAERNNVHRYYSRAELLRLKTLKASGLRPKHLANKFNNEDGLFSPDKWIDNIWRVEGVVDRCDSNKKNSKNEQSFSSVEHSTAYSPQKRTYSGGNFGKVELPEEADKPRSRIRNRSSKSSGVDFRPAFQKNASTTPVWQRPRSPMNNKRDWSARESHPRSSTNKTYERGGAREEEETPEWFDAGPVSVDELMDLGGFGDEDALDGEQAEKRGDGGTPLQKLSQDGEVAEVAFLPNSKEPPPDDEFIDCFKLMNLAMDDELLALQTDNVAPLGGSRLSRFFSSEQPPEKVPDSGGGTTAPYYAEALPCNGGHQPAASHDQTMGQTSPIYSAPPVSNDIIANATPGQPAFSLKHHQSQQQAPGYAQSLQNRSELSQLPPAPTVGQGTRQSSPFNLGNGSMSPHYADTGQALMGTATCSSNQQPQQAQQAQIAQALSSIQFQLQQYAHLPVFQAFMRRYNTAYVTMLQQGASMNGGDRQEFASHPRFIAPNLGISTEQARVSFIQGALQQWQRYLEQVKLQQQQQQTQLMQQSQPHPQLSIFNGHVYNGNGSLAYTSQQQHVQPNGLGMAPDSPAFYSQQLHQLGSSAAPASSSMPQAFSYQLNIPTSDFGYLQNQLKQAINRGDIEAQKSIRSQMLEALNGGQ